MCPFFQPQAPLKQKDFYLLSEIYCREIEKMLPVRGTLDFWGPSWGEEQRNKWAGAQGVEKSLAAYTSALNSGIIEGKIILPLHIEDGDNVAVVVGSIDPGLLDKIDHEWLSGFRDEVQERLEEIKKDFTDPVTGLYNSRLLMDSLEQLSLAGRNIVFSLICVKSRSRTVTEQLPRTVQAGCFIDATIRAALFYLGGNVFGLLQDNLSRQESLKAAHRLLNRLKREGWQSAHIGIILPNEIRKGKGAVAVLEECWRALETAERRGTFSLCEASNFENTENHPLAHPDKRTLSRLRKKWRGIKKFSLLLLSMENLSADPDAQGKFTSYVRALLPAEASFLPLSSRLAYILVPDMQAARVVEFGKRIQSMIVRKYTSVSVALGISHWPMLNFTKTESAVNCRKALMHGRFFGPGSVTVFDHVSLNVSGDYFFDEGDYRQAVRDYRNGVRLAPGDINLLNSLGVALTALNRIREAVVYFDQVLTFDPDDFMALVNMGFAQRILGNQGQAVQCFEKASRHDEFAASGVREELSLQLGRLYCDTEQYDRALVLLEKLERKTDGPQGYSLFLLLGEALAGTGRNGEAISCLQQAVRSNPYDAHALSLLGKMYALENQGNEIALSLCQKAVNIDDTSWQHWHRLALIQFRMGLLEDARNSVLKSLRINRSAGEPLSLAEQIYSRSGDESRARSMRNRLLKIARTDQKTARAMRN